MKILDLLTGLPLTDEDIRTMRQKPSVQTQDLTNYLNFLEESGAFDKRTEKRIRRKPRDPGDLEMLMEKALNTLRKVIRLQYAISICSPKSRTVANGSLLLRELFSVFS